MPSPFPGMDPYIEGQGWAGFRSQLIVQLQRELAPLVRPRFVVLIEEHIYLASAEVDERGRARPDALIAERREPLSPTVRPRAGAALLEAPVTLALPRVEVERQVYLEIRRHDTGRLVCVIELLSPANKAQGPARQEYLRKRTAVLESPAHLVELDLLRGGERLPMGEPLPPAACYAFVTRADCRPDCGVWPIQLPDRLPTLPIPLAGDPAPVPLDLQAAFDLVYDAALYVDVLDYSHGTVPPLSPEEAAWAEVLLARRRT